MKKTALLLSSVMALTCIFVGCGSKSSDKEEKGLVGKWSATDETLKDVGEEAGEGEVNVIAKSAVVEFTADGKIITEAVADYSEGFCLKDDGFYYMGQKIPYDYDGKSLTIGTAVYERIGDPDESSPYGKYKLEDEGEVWTFNFESAGVCLGEFLENGEYTYDEETKTLTTTLDDEDGPSTVEIDGDTLKLTDKEGTEVYTRVK